MLCSLTVILLCEFFTLYGLAFINNPLSTILSLFIVFIAFSSLPPLQSSISCLSFLFYVLFLSNSFKYTFSMTVFYFTFSYSKCMSLVMIQISWRISLCLDEIRCWLVGDFGGLLLLVVLLSFYCDDVNLLLSNASSLSPNTTFSLTNSFIFISHYLAFFSQYILF